MNFGKAIEALKQGKKVTRKGWSKNMYVYLDENKMMVLKTTNGKLENWSPTYDDMLLNIWHIYNEGEETSKQPRFDAMENNKMGEDIGSILTDIEKWADGDKENRAFILIATDKNLQDKKNNAQTVFHMQGDEGINAFAVAKILGNKECKQFKAMMTTCLIMDKMVGAIFK